MTRSPGLARRAGITRAAVAFAIIACVLASSAFDSSDGGHERQSAPAAAAPTPTPAAAENGSAVWAKRWWIEKTARLLRGGQGLGPDDDIDALMALPEDEIARRFMRDPRFGDTILDFNLYFLGFKPDSLKSSGYFDRYVFGFPNAIASAQALINGGDYFKLFDFEGPFFMAPLRLAPLDDPLEPGDAGLSPPALRAKAVGEVEVAFAALIEAGTAEPPPEPAAYCKRIEVFAEKNAGMSSRVWRAFNDFEIFALLRGRAVAGTFTPLSEALLEHCTTKALAADGIAPVVAALKEASAQFSRTFAEVLKHEPARYHPRELMEIKPFDLSAFANVKSWLAFGYEQGTALANSSTNYNRRRAAYVLRRFFCDDLTPVGFEDPQEHVGGEHGSETSCYACHYKLDPMAGFFRNYGAQFYDFSHEATISFDDLATANLAEYARTWRAPPASKRRWNVGYVRSPRWEDQNSYGETLGDLSRIVRQAPEAKRCVMKRLFEYMVAENQTIDGGYLEELTRNFTSEAAVNSSMAMKEAIIRIVRSNSFHQRDPEPRRCYDSGPTASPFLSPPCRVAFILQKNCTQCHDTVYGGDANLDLSEWIVAPDGRNRTFPHLDRNLNQFSVQETLTRIIDRLSSSNPKTRMPKNRLMSSQERQELVLWAQEQLARIAKGESQ